MYPYFPNSFVNTNNPGKISSSFEIEFRLRLDELFLNDVLKTKRLRRSLRFEVWSEFVFAESRFSSVLFIEPEMYLFS
jgi:hypothetical protein